MKLLNVGKSVAVLSYKWELASDCWRSLNLCAQ